MSRKVINPADHAMFGGSHGLPARVYYHIKPFLPARVRWALRRVLVPGILTRNDRSWPIDELASRMPHDWDGWPGGKRFAFVLTHDVESAEGVGNVRHLAELEMSHGFRSSYNFIPEGSYRDPVEIREWLVQNGFEVGVHDLSHDGHLYESRECFSRNAKKINSYLRDWKAVGFRSGFMLRQLEWLHELDVLYDASTFDTDPFEPQPDGARTIFPFQVKPNAGGVGAGYVELPYTLPQDSTLFLLLREKTADIWKRKLEWIVSKGGMALVNIHPDYVDFSERNDYNMRYPSALISDFMEHVQSEYQGEYWNPLARDLAAWHQGRPVGSLNVDRDGSDSA